MSAARRCLVPLLLLASGVCSAQEADLAVGKSGPALAPAGSAVTYVVTLANNGPDSADEVTLRDPLPAGMTFASQSQLTGPAFACSSPAVGDPGEILCSVASLPAGAGASFEFVMTIPLGTPDGTFFTNIATATTATFDPNVKNDSAVAVTSTPLPASADVSIAKTGPSGIGADTDVTYTLVVGNAGPDAAGEVTVSDTLPGDMTFVSLQQTGGPTFSCSTPAVGAGGAVQCTRPDLASGASATFTLVGHVPGSAQPGTEYQNTANVASATDPNEENNSASTTGTVASADVGVTKSAPPSGVGGTDLTYTLTVTNAGPDFAVDAQLLDTLPPQTTFVSLAQAGGPIWSCSTPAPGAAGQIACTVAALPASASTVFTLVVRVSNLHPGGVLTNTAQVSAATFDPDASDAQSSASTTITPASTDLSASKSAAASVLAGTNLSYSLAVQNVSANPALSPSFVDALPTGTGFVSLTQTTGPSFSCTTPAVGAGGSVNCNAATLAAAASAQFTLVVSVPANATNGSTLVNSLTATSANPDASGANNTATANTQVINQGDLSVTKSGPANGIAGGTLGYTIGVANAGPSPANAVVLADPLPAGTRFVSLTQVAGPVFACTTPAAGSTGTVNCSLATLASGGSASFLLTVSVDPAVAAGASITNVATVASTTSDPAAPNNSASSTATISNFVDLSASKTGPASVVVGSPIAYQIGVSNAGTSPALNVQLSDPLPAGTTFASLVQTSGPAFTCTTPAVGANGTVACTLASLPAGGAANFALTVNASPTPMPVSNTATVSSTSVEAGMANNASSAATQVVAGGAIAAVTVPALDSGTLLLLVLLLAFGALRLRRE